MIHFDVNIDIGSIDYAQALARFFFELKEIMVTAGWIVRGSGDGSARFALDGVTAALDPSQQGSGGDFDCWMTDGTAALGTPGGAWAQGAWVLLEEPVGGGGRQYVFQMTTYSPTVGNWGGYGTVAYSRVGDFNGGTPGPSVAPTSATAQFLHGSSLNSSGVNILYNVNDLYRAHVWADDAPVSGAFGFGGFATRATNTPQAFFGQVPLGPAEHVASDGDPTVHLAGSNTPTFRRWLLFGTGSASWTSISVSMGTANYWQGGGPSNDARDGLDRIAKIPLYMGAGSSNEQLAGMTEHMRWSASPRAYPDFCRDQNGDCWVWTTSGLLMPWPSAAPPSLPPTPE